MTSPYKRMFVLTEEEYLDYKRHKEANRHQEPATCPVDGHIYPNENILAHHMKTHVDGFQCNICGKVFKTKQALNSHLRKHSPQIRPSSHSIFDPPSLAPAILQTPLVSQTAQLTVPNNIRKHKHRSVLNFDTSKWLTLK
jgi:methionyl-tRNA synthetase